MYKQRTRMGKNPTLLDKYSARLATLIEREDMAHALFAAQDEAEQSARAASVAIVEAREANRAMTESDEWLRTTLEHLVDGVVVINDSGEIESLNGATERLFGYQPEEIVGAHVRVLVPGSGPDADDDYFSQFLRTGKKTPIGIGEEVFGRHKDGGRFPLDIEFGEVQMGDRRRLIATLRDITERKEAEALIVKQANYDSLTKLPNRTLFMDRLSLALTRASRNGGQIGLLFIDLDNFKKVNDTLGHSAGDQLLQEAAERLTACVRETDTVARLGGDEFTIILPDLQKAHDVEQVVRQILDRLSKPYLIDGTEVFASGSVGITLFPDDGKDAETLLKNSDTAMYRAKYDGRNTFRFFTAKMNAEALESVKLENQLRHAVDRGEFVLHYQPIIDLESGRVAGAEALLRWNHPVDGIVSPIKFIPLAEETGLIVPIGDWVFKAACEQIREWHDIGLNSLHVSVNLSPRQCREITFYETFEDTLRTTGADPNAVTLEITENLLMESDNDDAVTMLHKLRDQGVHLSLDDFGTGYSSLSYLKRFPFDVLKIDRSFVKDVATDPEDKALIEAMIAMAHGLNIKVVGEGAETREQVDFLRSRNCDAVQGYYFSKPIPADQFIDLARNQYLDVTPRRRTYPVSDNNVIRAFSAPGRDVPERRKTRLVTS